MTPIAWVLIMTIVDTQFGCVTETKVPMATLRECVKERNALIERHIDHDETVEIKIGCYQK